MKTFTGKECMKICKNCDFDRRFTSTDDHIDITKLLRDFYRIHMGITHNFYISNLALLKPRVAEWQERFNKVFHLKHQTPYMHLMYDHITQLIEQEGDIDVFNIQGLEKLNDNTSTEYFRKTNKKKDFIEQMIRSRSRTEFFRITSLVKRESENKQQHTSERENFFKTKDLFSIDDLRTINDRGVIADEDSDDEYDSRDEREQSISNVAEETSTANASNFASEMTDISPASKKRISPSKTYANDSKKTKH